MSEPTLHPSSMAREYRKGNWTLQETLILITAKKLDDERRLKGPSSSSSSPSSSTRNSGELRWKWVENYCWTHGCLRSQNQCNDKWDNLLRDYKKVREYEATKSSSSSSHVSNNNEFRSYWTMEKHQRKEQKLPSNMLLQVYQAVTQILNNKSHTSSQLHHHHQHHLVVNVVHSPSQEQQHVPLLASHSQPLSQTAPVASQPLLLLPPPSLPPPPVDSTTPPISEGSESSGTENKHKDDNSESKRRKFEQKLGSSIMQSASELAQALGSCEEKKEKRHQEMMELHHRALHSQQTRDQVNHHGITNLVSAVTNLIAVIQSLITSINKDHAGGNDDGDACSS